MAPAARTRKDVVLACRTRIACAGDSPGPPERDLP